MNCPTCPVAAGLRCLGSIHPSFCDPVLRGEPGRRDQAIAVARSMAGQGPDPAAPILPAARAAIDAELCRWADPDGPCGCGTGPPRRCRKPGRPPLAMRAYCLACVLLPDWDGRPAK
ncbi:MAG: hypothetical protein INR70_08810 [Parafilimonas terrae]|nr:hypothetical protein [Parafilimonas terrae]